MIAGQQLPTGLDADATRRTDIDRKAHERLAATAALTGCCLFRLDSGGWLLCRSGMARDLPDLAAVDSLLRQMGARG